MKISEVIARLQSLQEAFGDHPVMFTDPQTGSVWGTFIVEKRTALANEFEKDWDMPDIWHY